MSDLHEEPQPSENSEEYQNFESLVKKAFAMPKSEMESAEYEANKKARRRVPVKSAQKK